MVNLELYKIYVTVAKEQNITRASEKLNISQPAVTKHIKIQKTYQKQNYLKEIIKD